MHDVRDEPGEGGLAPRRRDREPDEGHADLDAVARAAVRALAAGRAQRVDDAIDLAIHETRARSTRRPSRAMLRAHAQALEESEHGPLARHLRREACIDECLTLLAVLEQAVLAHDPEGDARPAPTVHGRAALGHFDLDPSVHARVVTALPSSALAQAIVDAGFDEPHCTSVATRYGRIDELCFAGASATYRLRRIPPALRVDPARSLTGTAATPSADYSAVAALSVPLAGGR
jgi:hypothetical protein